MCLFQGIYGISNSLHMYSVDCSLLCCSFDLVSTFINLTNQNPVWYHFHWMISSQEGGRPYTPIEFLWFCRKSLLNAVLILILNMYSVLTGAWFMLLFPHFCYREPELAKVAYQGATLWSLICCWYYEQCTVTVLLLVATLHSSFYIFFSVHRMFTVHPISGMLCCLVNVDCGYLNNGVHRTILSAYYWVSEEQIVHLRDQLCMFLPNSKLDGTQEGGGWNSKIDESQLIW